jgi:hypothetical protein
MNVLKRCLVILVALPALLTGISRGEDFIADGVEIYVPDSLGPGEKLRGSLEFRPFEGAKRWVDHPYMRDFANRAKFVIAAGFPAREKVAEAIGHPEYVNIPMVRMSHSGGFKHSLRESIEPANRPRALAVVSHNAYGGVLRRYPVQAPSDLTVDKDDPRCEIPTIAMSADRNFMGLPWGTVSGALTMYRQVGEAAGFGHPWSTLMEHGASHMGMDPQAMRLLGYWLEDVAALQIPDAIPDDGRVTLKTIDVTQGWVAYAEFVPSKVVKGSRVGTEPDRYVNIACYPCAEAPGSGVVDVDGNVACYVWMPSERVARYWVNYHKYGNIDGDTRIRHTRAWDVLNDGIKGTWQGYERIRNQGWNCPAFDILNLPGFDRSDHSKLQWNIVSGEFPTGLELGPLGRIRGTATKGGIYKFTLRATYEGKNYDEVHYLPLRGSNARNTLKINIREPANLQRVALPLTVRWESDEPLGLLEWHSSLDGDLGVADGELGTSGEIRLGTLKPGTHAITLHAYSSTTFHREAETVVVIVGGDTSSGRSEGEVN